MRPDDDKYLKVDVDSASCSGCAFNTSDECEMEEYCVDTGKHAVFFHIYVEKESLCTEG